jgi:hypothetical protein
MLRTLHVLPLPRVTPFAKGWLLSTAPTFSRLWVRRLYYIVHCRYMNSGYAAPDVPWFDLHHVILSNVDKDVAIHCCADNPAAWECSGLEHFSLEVPLGSIVFMTLLFIGS